MSTTTALSVVIPAFDAAATIGRTIDALVVAVERAGAEVEVVLVDDGSTDGTAAEAERALGGRLSLRVLRQENSGRLSARTAGIEAATADWVLLLDSRVELEPEALAFVLSHVHPGARVWTGHVHVRGSSPLARFWALIAELAWSDYFDDPRTVAFGAEDFDRYPKGTTCFLAPRGVLLDAIAAFRSAFADPRNANDDTPVIRWIAEREPIHVSPAFGCAYEARTTLGAFVRHSVHRGVVFVDGHGRRGSRFRPAVLGFYPVSLVVATWVGLRPRRILAAWMAGAGAAAALGVARRRSAADVRALAAVTPLYAVAHGLGMWRALVLLCRRRASRS